MNGPLKDAGKDSKNGQSSQSNGQSQAPGQHGPDASPRNSVIGTVPPTSGLQPQAPPGVTGVPPPPSSSASSSTPAPGPGPQPPPQSGMPSMLGMPMNMGSISVMNSTELGMFEPQFIEDLDVFKTEDNLNFERDFGEWLNTQESTAN